MKISQAALVGLLTSAMTLMLLAGSSTAGDKKNQATVPLNRDVQRHEKFLAIDKKGNVDVVFIGDSITQGWEGKGASDTWKKNYEPLKGANFGIGGDQTGHVLWRITEGKELDNLTPKVAVVMIGTNNSGRDSAEEIAEGIGLIVNTIHQKTPKTKILLLGVFPRGLKTGAKSKEETISVLPKISEINKIIAKLDDGGKTVKYLDIGSKFLQPDGTLSKEIMNDFLHLTPKGYEIWAEAMNPTLRAMLK